MIFLQTQDTQLRPLPFRSWQRSICQIAPPVRIAKNTLLNLFGGKEPTAVNISGNQYAKVVLNWLVVQKN